MLSCLAITLINVISFTQSTAQQENYVLLRDPAASDPLCAEDQPSMTTKSRSAVTCAGQCRQQGDCVGVNFLLNSLTCQLFSYKPNAYSIQPSCSYYQARENSISEMKRVKNNYYLSLESIESLAEYFDKREHSQKNRNMAYWQNCKIKKQGNYKPYLRKQRLGIRISPIKYWTTS